jgi:hypothetical protein
MPTFMDANTATRFVFNPLLITIAGRRIGPTRGGATFNRAIEIVQPEMDGVNQPVRTMEYIRSDVPTLEFQGTEFSPENLLLMNQNVAATGTAPNLTYTPYANMQMMDEARYVTTNGGVIAYGQFTDAAVPGFFFIAIPSALVQVVPSFGANGEATLAFTVTGRAAPGTPDGKLWNFGRIAAIPAEVGGP